MRNFELNAAPLVSVLPGASSHVVSPDRGRGRATVQRNMLEAGWNQFEQEYFAQRVQIDTKELEYMTARFNGLTLAASVLAGFAFTALVELDISTEALEQLEAVGKDYMEGAYFVSIGLTISFNLYIIMVATMSSLKAQRMALHGNVSNSLIHDELPANLGFAPGKIGEAGAPSLAADVRPPPVGVERSYSRERRKLEQDDVHRAIRVPP